MKQVEQETLSSGKEHELNYDGFGQCPLPITRHDTVQLGHGSGGKMMNDLITKLFVWAFDNDTLRDMGDAATFTLGGARLAISTDSFVVDPVFFPGGDIGELAVYGTVNDVAMTGARPVFLSAGVILEEGFPLDDLKRIVTSMKRAADRAGVSIVTGDTKVVNKGKGDKIFINTTGIGILETNWDIGPNRLVPGDKIIISGGIAEHGIAILSKREGLGFETPILSDAAPLNELIASVLEAAGDSVHALRDPTRGGVASALNEFATASGVGIRLFEEKIPVEPAVSGACEILGLDPLHVANEGKLLLAVSPDIAPTVMDVLRSNPLAMKAEEIGEVVKEPSGLVSMQTAIGGWRIVDMLVGEQLPRIC